MAISFLVWRSGCRPDRLQLICPLLAGAAKSPLCDGHKAAPSARVESLHLTQAQGDSQVQNLRLSATQDAPYICRGQDHSADKQASMVLQVRGWGSRANSNNLRCKHEHSHKWQLLIWSLDAHAWTCKARKCECGEHQCKLEESDIEYLRAKIDARMSWVKRLVFRQNCHW